jgi:hypothetical protein
MEPHPVSPVSTFIVRFWQEWSASGPHWRGRISHVPSGDSAVFTSLEEMNQLIIGFGAMSEKETRLGDDMSRDADNNEP